MTLEIDFMKELMLAVGSLPSIRIHRQNCGKVEVYKRGRVVGIFDAGPPPGAADLSGIVGPEGYRLEIEVKGEKTKVREHQESWERMIKRHGGVHVLVRYDESLTMTENVADAVRAVEEAIQQRRASCVD